MRSKAEQGQAWSLARGELLRRTLRSDPGLEYQLYLPTRARAGAPLLVAVHGDSARWPEKAAAFVPLCEKLGIALLTPGMAGEAHTDFQRLGRVGHGPRADEFLHRCLGEVATLAGVETAGLRLFGHSGGAQFVHRYTMAFPQRVAAAVIAGAGWYTFPDPGRAYPYGIRAPRRLPGVQFNPEQYLRVPIKVVVGDEDVGPGRVRGNVRLDETQGKTRLERARRWTAAMHAQAAAFDLPARVQLAVLPGVGHSYEALCRDGGLVENTMHMLFGLTAGAPSRRAKRFEPAAEAAAP